MRWWQLAAVGAVGGTLCDQLHVRSHTLAYTPPGPGLAGQPWWVAPQFAVATLVLVAAAWRVAGQGAPRHDATAGDAGGLPRPPALPHTPGWVHSGLGIALLVLLVGYAASAALHRHLLLDALVLALLAGSGWLAWCQRRCRRVLPTRGEALVVAGLVVLGPAWEAWLVHAGRFHYLHTAHGAAVPVWLALLYACGAPLALTVVADHPPGR